MSDEPIKNPLNVPGRYYVTSDCLFCEVCIEAAPNHFRLSEEHVAYVFKQPETPGEERRCREALEGCPLGAIRDDGEPQAE
jgi:ferredoxin